VFADLVRGYRQRLGLTQDELAERSGLAVRTIRQIEAGQVRAPRPPTVRLLADTFALTGTDRDRFCLAARRVGTDRPAATVRPAQLPSDLASFAGRARHLAALDRLAGPARPASTAIRLATVSGTAGVGKTALAVHWAHRVAGRFPDGQLYLDLHGFDQTGRLLSPAEAVPVLLAALGVPAGRLPADLTAQVGLYRSVLAGRRILIVLDNARDAEQVRPLLPGAPTAMAVVTSRSQLTGLVAADGAEPLALDPVPPAEARQVLVRRLGADRVAAEPAAVDRILAVCAGLPLALAVTAARVQQADATLAELADELGSATRRLDALDTGDPANEVRTVFSWSYAALPAPAARLFRLLGLHPGPEISAPAAASLAGQPLPAARRLLAELTRANLLTEQRPRRYALHDLLRAYAADLAAAQDSAADRRAAQRRLLDHYTHTAHAADRLLSPHRDPIVVPLAAPAAGALPEGPADHPQAMDWLATEHQVLLAVLGHAARTGSDTHAWQLAWALHTFLDRRGFWPDLACAVNTAVGAAQRLGDPTAEAYAHRIAAAAQSRLRRHDAAHQHYQQALARYVEAGDAVGQAYTHRGLAYQWERQGDLRQALQHAEIALDRAAGHRSAQAHALNAIGWYETLLGDHARAGQHCRRALALFEQLGDRYGQAHTWDTIGYAQHQRGELGPAADSYRQALALLRSVADRYHEADTLTKLGRAQHAAGDANAGRAAWQQALRIFTELERQAEADAVGSLLDGLDPATGTEPATRSRGSGGRPRG
jgi:tetratricopeptide (TPR) repeat protein/transcriptional regulator with XRE-family HTH domain